MDNHRNAYGSSSIPGHQMTDFNFAQNPSYPSAVPENYYVESNPVYMPPPPPYNINDPAVSTYNPYPVPEQPQQAFVKENNVLDVELAPPYTSGMEDSSPFSEKAIRRAFIRKVYITLAIQLAVTFGIICMFVFWKSLKHWVQGQSYFAFGFCGAALLLVLVFSCCDSIRRKVPLNFIFLGIFTVIEGCMLGAISALYDADAVMWAAGATIFVTLGLTLFALQTKWDFTMMSGGLCMALFVLLSFGILCAIIRSQWLQIVYASIGTLIFGMYLVVDTQMIVGGKHRYSVSPEEYIYAALNIYLDIVNLFILLLQLIGICR
ncbi:protein lifeguard 1 [Bombina bombina]|uniref:protein lifeguard 1 n=1 Tax=Bombina bombina TaxID=8345 RepID=UPI00235AB8A9|nr:protein lifeguard 1 [Bombina bombina]XP_053570010.1 protein lifeguard 1 [Bombina bombina]